MLELVSSATATHVKQTICDEKLARVASVYLSMGSTRAALAVVFNFHSE